MCEPSPGVDEGFAAERDPTSENVVLARAIADRYMDEHEATSLKWDWGEATFLVGVVDLYRLTGEQKYSDYLQAYIDHHIGRYVLTQSDRCPSSVAAIELYRQGCDEKYQAVVDDIMFYLDEEALRTEQGGLNHLGTVDLFPPSLWIDSLFMFGTPLTRWGTLTNAPSRLDFYADQFRIFTDVLQEDAGFYRHAYNWGAQDDDVYWARGNGWVLAASGEYLQSRVARGESDDFVATAHRTLAQAVIDAQDPATGLWWTVINRPGETYLETSAAALFALGLARGYRAGILDQSVLTTVNLALQGVKSRIEDDEQGRPVVTGISGPTGVGGFEFYADIEQEPDIHYGVGAVVLALIETSGLE